MTTFLSLFIYISTSLVIANQVSERGDRNFLMFAISLAWLFFVPLVSIMNELQPFTILGDDERYFAYGTRVVSSWLELSNFSRFVGVLEQPGYAITLSTTHYLIGANLLSLKLQNVF